MTRGGWKAPSNIPRQGFLGDPFFSAQGSVDTVVDIQSGGGQLHPMANKDRATNPRRTNRVVTGGCYRCIPRFPD